MTKVLFHFTLLQVADLTTTLMALRLGAVEKNPLTQLFLALGPFAGLLLSKIIALLIGAACVVLSRERALRRANVVFAAVVTWNAVAIARLLSSGLS